MDPVTIASLGAGALQTIQGFIQKSKAAKLAASNPRPVYKIQQPILDNQNIAEAQAGRGLDDATTQAYTTGAQRGLTASIDAILRGGGSVNNIADLESNYEGGVSRMALLDSQMRANNVRQLLAQNNALAGEQDKAWQINTYAPYADRAQAAAQLQQQGEANVWKGINTGVNALGGMQQGNMWKQETNALFGGGRQSFDTQQPATANLQPVSGLAYPGQQYAPQYAPNGLINWANNLQGFQGPQRPY